MNGERFSVHWAASLKPFGNDTFGIVDEKAGNIIGYINDEHLACLIVGFLNENNSTIES